MRSVDLRKLPSRGRGAPVSNRDLQVSKFSLLYGITLLLLLAGLRFTMAHTLTVRHSTASCNVSNLKLLLRFYSQILFLPHSDRCTSPLQTLIN